MVPCSGPHHTTGPLIFRARILTTNHAVLRGSDSSFTAWDEGSGKEAECRQGLMTSNICGLGIRVTRSTVLGSPNRVVM